MDTQLGGAENEMNKDIEEIYKEEKGFYNLSSNGHQGKRCRSGYHTAWKIHHLF